MEGIENPGIPKGRRLALDYGLVRIGVSVSDPDGQFAFPSEVLDTHDWERGLSTLITEYEPVVIYIGFPINLSGDEGSSARLARDFALEIASIFDGEIRLVDERLTTKSALNEMKASGKSEKESRSVIDAAAATHLLEGILLRERSQQSFAGHRI
jgi:putative Holliday junction resolvase